jgi:hypothetical protein
MNLHEAIYSLYPEVVIIRGEEAFDRDDKFINYDKAAVATLVTTPNEITIKS